jgi:hypothetical protein
MKKVICFVLGATLAVAAGAQTWQDALLFSENNYSGTARGVGMGNALTAIGGDAGSLTFNPAGSAVASYSQFEITPGFTFSVANVGAAYDMSIMADKRNTVFGAVKVPNLGFIFNLDTGRRSGLKRMSFGFVVNATNNFTGRFNASGVNDDNSYAASLASSADGFASNVLGNEDWYYGGDPTRMPAWVDMTGYRAGMFNSVVGRDGAYVALTEIIDSKGDFRLAAPVYQEYGQQSRGGKHDILLNYAMNFSDKLYIGANLGVSVLRYSLAEYWSEKPENPADFPIIQYSDGATAQFESLRMRRNYRLDGNGVYFKVGALWRPVAGLRIGAAIQTPTMLNLRERYGYSGEVVLSGRYGGTASSPEDDWIYALRTPFRANLGLAYTLGNVAVISADYEYVNYASAVFRSRSSENDYSIGSFSDVNMDIRDLLGASHQLRVGTEVKVTPAVALRAGYNLITSGERNAQLLKHNLSLGVGLSFGSFFLDAAVRGRLVPAEYFIPYYYYYAPNPNQFYNKVVDDEVLTPEVVVKSAMVDALITLGWRF